VATHRIPILGWATVPDNSGEVFFEPMSILATNDTWPRMLLRFGSDNTAQPTTRIGCRGGFTVPKNYSAGANLIVVWTSTLTTGDAEWDFDYRAVGGNDVESLDQATSQETVNANDTAPSAAWERMEISIALTDANFTADDEVLFEFFRDGTDAGDTIAGSALLFALLFEYTD